MHELVEAAIAAHGGLDRWKTVRQVSAGFRTGGLGLKQRGPVGDAVADLQMRVSVDTHEQRTVFEPFAAPGQRGVYRPDRTCVETLGGALAEHLAAPRDNLKAMVPGAPWSAAQILYFVGYSLWMYLNLPFAFLRGGITCEEVAPWVEAGEAWRGLKVTYPPGFPSHSTEQMHYFDAAGLMRRQDYTVDVRQNLSAAHYMSEFITVEGLVFPTQRRIWGRGPDGRPNRERLLIGADFTDFRLVHD
jgi:hypothetical protein